MRPRLFGGDQCVVHSMAWRRVALDLSLGLLVVLLLGLGSLAPLSSALPHTNVVFDDLAAEFHAVWGRSDGTSDGLVVHTASPGGFTPTM